ncbi:MAG: hypothetical protein LBL86_03610 [Coriobacteriales bacterium]|nr:hypothetical protein [Coriobacteriales bacterium]
MRPAVAFITLGCAKNEVDSDKMCARALAAGYREARGPAEADVVVVNTCSFITEATDESIAAIFEALALERLAAGRAHLVVAGCMPSRYGEALSAGLPEAAAFVPCADEHDIVTVLDSLPPLWAEDGGEGRGRPSATRPPVSLGLCQDRRRLRPPLHLLHDPAHPGPLSQRAGRRGRRRGRGAGGRRRA